MENAIQKIHHRKFGDVRVVILNGTVYFMGRDVATALGFKDTTRAIRAHVVAEDKKFVKPSDLRVGELPALFPNNGAFFINESGLYSLILSSKLPLAQEFKHWITSEVLPSIRKFGYYVSPAIEPPQIQPPKPKKPKIKDDLDLETLKFLIDRCENGKLREELIRKAATGILEPLKCVYILEMSNGTIKIGITQDFQQRARQIINSTGAQVANWCHTGYLPVEIARDIEKACHEHFNACRVDGEFFETDFKSAVTELSNLTEILDFMEIQ